MIFSLYVDLCGFSIAKYFCAIYALLSATRSDIRKWVEASADKSGRKMKSLFAEFMESGEDWLSSSLVMSSSQMTNETTGGRYGWLSREETSTKNWVFFSL